MTTATERRCIADGCTERHHSRGYCKLHYQRMRLTGQTELRTRPTEPAECLVAGCTSTGVTRGWCVMHYARFKRHGDVNTVKKPYQNWASVPVSPPTRSMSVATATKAIHKAAVSHLNARAVTAPQVRCTSCPSLFTTRGDMQAHDVATHGTHYHRWRMESPNGPEIRGECACGATRVDPASPPEYWEKERSA